MSTTLEKKSFLFLVNNAEKRGKKIMYVD